MMRIFGSGSDSHDLASKSDAKTIMDMRIYCFNFHVPARIIDGDVWDHDLVDLKFVAIARAG